MPVSLFLGMCCVSLWDALVLLRVERSFVSLVVRLCGLLFIGASLCVCDVVVFMTLRKSLHMPVMGVQCSVYAGVVYLLPYLVALLCGVGGQPFAFDGLG